MYCRICLLEVRKSMQFTDENTNDFIRKIFFCFQVVITQSSLLEFSMCQCCIEELNISYNFRLKCLNSEKKIIELIQSQDDNKSDISDIKTSVDSGNDQSTIKQTHLLPKDMSILGTFVCDICNKVLKTEQSLSKHKLRMHQNRKHLGCVTGYGGSRRYHCTKCPYSTPHSQTLINHIRRHSGERPFNCKDCGKNFTQSSSLAAHSKIHSNHTYYTCSVCGRQFKHAFTLKKHLLVHETATYLCDICNKYLKSRESLQAHKDRHNNVYNFNCEECGDTFVTSSELINHRKKHNKVKTIECHLCGYRTHTKKVLILHLKRHTGEKSIRCDLCDKSCYTTGELKTHKRVHTREKPYNCPACFQRFMHSTSVNKHMRNVHGVSYKWGDVKNKLLKGVKQVI